MESNLSKRSGSNEWFWNLLMISLVIVVFYGHKCLLMPTMASLNYFAATEIFTSTSFDVWFHDSMVHKQLCSKITLKAIMFLDNICSRFYLPIH